MKINNTAGFMMVTTIFIVVFLSLIGTFIVQTSMVTNQSGNLDVLQNRAYFAAKSGIEWLNYQNGPISGGVCPTSPTTLSLTEGGLKGFSVVVTCSALSFTEGATTYNMFSGTAVATFGGAISSINYARYTLNQVAAAYNAP